MIQFAVHHSGGPRPPARQPDAIVRRHTAAGGRQGSGCEERSRRERFVLRALVEQRQHPVVQRVETDGPGAGRAAVRHPTDRIEDGRKVGLAAAVAHGQQQVGKARGVQVVDRGGRKPAQLFGLLCTLGQSGDELMADGRCGNRDRGHGRDATILFGMESRCRNCRQGLSKMLRNPSRWAVARRPGCGPARWRKPMTAAKVALARRSASSASNP
jgi:hypothetical protein